MGSLTIAVADPAERILSLATAEPDVLALGARRVRIVDCGWIAANLAGKASPLSRGSASASPISIRLLSCWRTTTSATSVSRANACGTFIEFQSARG
jgi:hypothetical protein